jgi:hypothetical protein
MAGRLAVAQPTSQRVSGLRHVCDSSMDGRPWGSLSRAAHSLRGCRASCFSPDNLPLRKAVAQAIRLGAGAWGSARFAHGAVADALLLANLIPHEVRRGGSRAPRSGLRPGHRQ